MPNVLEDYNLEFVSTTMCCIRLFKVYVWWTKMRDATQIHWIHTKARTRFSNISMGSYRFYCHKTKLL